MFAWSDYTGGNLLDFLLQKGNVSFSPPEALWVALFKVTPDAAGIGGTEVTEDGYARVSVDFDLQSSGVAIVQGDVLIGPAEEDWGAIHGVAFFDAAEGGNQLFQGDLAAPQVIMTGQTFRFPAGNLRLRYK